MKTLLFFALILSAGFANGQLTTVSQLVTNGDGTPFVGEVVIAVPPFSSRSQAVRSRDIWLCSSLNIITGCAQQIVNGVLTVQLQPNGGGSPAGTSYFVSYYPDVPPGRRPSVKTEYWVVPTGGPYTIDQVKVAVAPTPSILVSPTQLNPSGYTTGQFPCVTGGVFLPCSSSGGGAWGSITGTLSNQTDLQTALDGKATLAAGWQFVLVDPSGACVQGAQMRYNTTLSRIWGCSQNDFGVWLWQRDDLSPIPNFALRLTQATKNNDPNSQYVLLTNGDADSTFGACFVGGVDSQGNGTGIAVPGNCLIAVNGSIRVFDVMGPVGGGVIQANRLQLVRKHLALLGTCNSTLDGTVGYPDDLLAPAFLATAVSGGTARALVFCNGTNWIVQ